MRSQLLQLKIFFFILVTVLMGAIFIAQHRFSIMRSLAMEPDPMLAASEKKFSYLKDRKLETPKQILGANTEASQSAHAVQVLYYHGISEKENGTDVSFDNFREQMYLLKENGFETITAKQLEDYLIHGKPLPPHSFLLTFDDGRKDSFYPVDPVLKSLNYRAVMFLISSEIIDRDIYYLTEGEVKKMLETGRWEIQAHTLDSHKYIKTSSDGKTGHALTNKLWLEEAKRLESEDEYKKRIESDLFSSKKDLEQRFGVPVQDFAFPFGDYGQLDTNYKQAKDALAEIVQKLYRFAFFQSWDESDSKNLPHIDTKMIKRIGVEASWKGQDLLSVMLRGEGKYLPHTETFKDASSWLTTWGTSTVDNNKLELKSESTTTGASVILIGSDSWQDFVASATATLTPKTESVSILGRISSTQSYSECAFTKTGIYYREKNDGVSKVIAKKELDLEENFDDRIGIVMRMSGNNVSCELDDGSVSLDSVVSSKVPTVSQFGLSTWGSLKGQSSVVIDSLHISTPND